MLPYTQFTAFAHGEVCNTASATQMPSVPCLYVRFKAAAANTGKVYIGTSNAVSATDGTTDATSGLELNAKEDTGWMPVRNLNVFWGINTVAGDSVTYWAFGVA